MILLHYMLLVKPERNVVGKVEIKMKKFIHPIEHPEPPSWWSFILNGKYCPDTTFAGGVVICCPFLLKLFVVIHKIFPELIGQWEQFGMKNK